MNRIEHHTIKKRLKIYLQMQSERENRMQKWTLKISYLYEISEVIKNFE